jgi:hypothetical protein
VFGDISSSWPISSNVYPCQIFNTMTSLCSWVHDKILQTRKIKRQSVRQLLPLPSTGTTVREAHVSYGETKSWRAWEAIGLG